MENFERKQSLTPNISKDYLSPQNIISKSIGKQKSGSKNFPVIKKVAIMSSTMSIFDTSLTKAHNRVKDDLSNTRFHSLSKMLKGPSNSQKILKIKIAQNLRKAIDRNMKKQTQNSWIDLFENKVRERLNASNKILNKLRNENNISGLSVIHSVLEVNLRVVEAHIDECPNDLSRINLVNLCDQFGRNGLHYACCLGEIGCIEMLMTAGTDPRVKDMFGRTILHYAAFQGSKEVVELVKNLFEKSCKLNSGLPNCTNYRSIARLLKYKKLKKMAQVKKSQNYQTYPVARQSDTFNYSLINKESLKVLERMNISETKIKQSKGWPESFEALIDWQDAMGRTALHMSALFDKVAIIRILLDFGANPDIMDNNSTWPYELSSSRLASSILISRMKHKKKPNMDKSLVITKTEDTGMLTKDLLLLDDSTLSSFLTENSETYLHIAIKSKNLEAVKTLLSKNLSPLTVNKNNWNSVHFAVKSGCLKILCYLLKGHCDLEKDKVLRVQKKWITKAWSAMDQITAERHSIFHLAVLNGDNEMLLWLIDTCQKRESFLQNNQNFKQKLFLKLSDLLEIPGKKNYTCFLLSVKLNSIQLSSTLLTHGSFLYAKNEKLQNALHLAALKSSTPLIKLLIRSDSDQNRLRTEKDIKERFPKDLDPGSRLSAFFYHIWDYAKTGDLKSLTTLIKTKEYDVNDQTPKRKQTPLHVSVENKQAESIKTLFLLGADHSIKNCSGQTPFDLALTLEYFHFDSNTIKLLRGENIHSINLPLKSLQNLHRSAVKIKCRDLSESFTIPKFSSKRTQKILERETGKYWRLINEKILEKRYNFLELFRMQDEDKDNALSFLEFHGLLIFLGVSLKLEEIQQLAMTADTNQNGLIEYEELSKRLQGLGYTNKVNIS